MAENLTDKNYLFGRLLTIGALLVSAGILSFGHGLLNTVVGLRANVEGFSDFTIGIMTSAYFLGFIIGTYFCGILVPRVGHIRCFSVFASLASAVTLILIIHVGPLTWIGARLAYGGCLAALYMVMESWLNLVAENKERGQILSFYMLTIYIGIAGSQGMISLAPPESFTLFAVGSVLLSLALIPVAGSRMPQPRKIKTDNFSLIELAKTSRLATAGVFTTGMINGAFWGLAPIYLSDIGMDNAQVGWFIAFQYIGGLVLQWPIGYMSDRMDRRGIIVVLLLLSSAVSFYLYSMEFSSEFSAFALFMAGAFFFGGINSTLHSIFIAHANDFLKASQVVKASGGLLAIHAVGAIIGPLLATVAVAKVGASGLPFFTSIVAGVVFFFSVYRMMVGKTAPKHTHTWFVPIPRAGMLVPKLDPRRTDVKKDDKTPGL